MPNSPSANPTPVTPPRVPLIDDRTGLISRAWYMFFLSLYDTSQAVVDPSSDPSATALLASYTAELESLSQTVGTQFNTESLLASLEAALAALNQQLATQPPVFDSELRQDLDKLRQEVATLPHPQLGTFAALQQASLPWTTFDTTAQSVPTDIGTVAWDGGTTLNIQMTPNVLQRVGETEFVYVKASATITKGQLCYHTGAVGSSGVITAAPTPIGLADPNQIVGVAAESIALNDFGLIQISGDLRGFNTTGSSVGEVWADGDPLYYNPAYVGSMTKVKPSAPNQKTYIGEVISAGSGGSGSMHVRIVQGSVLGGTDSNVQFSALADKDLIQYDAVAGYWKNVAPTAISIGTATNLASGAAGSVPYQTAASTTTFLPIGTAGQVLKVNSGATAPEWVSGAALTKVDDTNVTLTLGGSPTTSLLASTSLTLGWSGQLSVARGGTGAATTTANYVFAGPTSGGAAAPAFRALVTADIPTNFARTDTANSFTGNQTLSTGNAIQGTAGKGYDFAANTALAGKTSTLLNWYEEGTYTPTLTSGTGTITSYTVDAAYTRIGRSVTVVINAVITNAGTGAGAAIFTLPWTPNASYAFNGSGRENAVTGYMVQAYISVGGTVVNVLSYANLTVIATNAQIRITITYFV